MLNESPNQVIKELWQSQPVEGIKMSVEEIRGRASKFERRIFWRNVREYVGGAIAIALFISFFVRSQDNFFRTACALCIAGLVYMAYQLHRRASAQSLPAEFGAASSLHFYRGQLERQRDFIAHIWRWYLWPLIPGLAAFSLQAILQAHSHVLRVVLVNSLFAVCLIAAWKLNAYQARCLQRRIDELKAVE